MIAFLGITTVVNIALGYALAMYLGHAKTRPVTATESSESTLTLPTRKLASHDSPPAPTHSVMPAATETQAPTTPAPTITAVANQPPAVAPPSLADAIEATMDQAVAPATAGDDTSTAEGSQAAAAAEQPPVEHELLAGIEEFRSQLAQLKGTNAASPAAAPRAPAGATA